MIIINLKFKVLNFQIAKLEFFLLTLILLLAIFLRFYNLQKNPPGLYWDEVVYGYDAYSILKTGKDHHGQTLPLFFESFGDWKLPIYHYLLVPSIAFFGLNEFSVRLPSAIFGVFSVLTFFLLIKEITQNNKIALFSAFFLGISPWHVQFSRGGFESTVGLFFVLMGAYIFLIAIKNEKILSFTLAFLLLIFSMYTYHSFRIFTPLLIFSLTIIYYLKLKKYFAKVLLSLIPSILLLVPLIFFSFSPNGRLRATSESVFDKNFYEKERIKYDQSSKKPLRFLSKYWLKPRYYFYQVFNGYLDHFSPTFLFFRGDQIGRHSQVDMGQIYAFDGLLLIISVFAIAKTKKINSKLMVIWLVLSPLAASIVLPTPHAQRTLQMSVPLAFFSAIGAWFIYFKNRSISLKILLSVIIFYSFLNFTHLLFAHYPRKFAADWNDGYKQMVKAVEKYEVNYQKAYIRSDDKNIYTYVLFYQKYQPTKFMEQKGNFRAFGKYQIIDLNIEVFSDQPKILYAAPSWQKVDGKNLEQVYDSNGKHVYTLWEVGGLN